VLSSSVASKLGCSSSRLIASKLYCRDFVSKRGARLGELSLGGFESFKDSGALAAATICRTEHGNLHAGIVHRKKDVVEFLHLGWEDQLRTDWNWHVAWASPNVLPERLRSVSARCRAIWNRFQTTRSLPYGIPSPNATFSLSGEFALGDGGNGLTCSTFILAVMRSVGVELINEGTWPLRADEDRAWITGLAPALASDEMKERLNAQVDSGAVRIRPEEVLGAFDCVVPAAFDACVLAGKRMVDAIDAHGRAVPPPTPASAGNS
jgi:hypothetical protein